MLSDIQIAQAAKMQDIKAVASRLGLSEDDIITYGSFKAKIKDTVSKKLCDKRDGHLILVTAVNPTPAGEGKTTVSVGLGQALCKMGKNAVLALREPSLGPVFGLKGGAAGGGYSQVVPMEDINLHFTGDFHAVTYANNLLSAVIDNHIHQGNELGIDERRITFSRVIDLNDRGLRKCVTGLGGKANGFPREESFSISSASEIMAILCLSRDLKDLKEKLGSILIGYNFQGKPVFCRDLGCQGAMAVLLKDALLPNLVQTLENTPVLIHGGPFANIAHGCNSVRATKLGLKLGDYLVTEAGFGSDLGAEKFLDIKCRNAGLKPSAVVIVATCRALKYNAGISRSELKLPNPDAVYSGGENLRAHIDNILRFGLTPCVAINRFDTDSAEEIEMIKKICSEEKVDFAVADVFSEGGAGGLKLAEKVMEICTAIGPRTPIYSYQLENDIKTKIDSLVRRVYCADGAEFDSKAESSIAEIEAMGMSNLPICVAKTQYSLSDDPAKLARPRGFKIRVRDVRLHSGAGFIVVIAGDIMTMPGLPKIPAAVNIDIDDDGNITGLF